MRRNGKSRMPAISWEGFPETAYQRLFGMEQGRAGTIRMPGANFELAVYPEKEERTQAVLRDLLFWKPGMLDLPTDQSVTRVSLVNWETLPYAVFQTFLTGKLLSYFFSGERQECERILLQELLDRMTFSLTREAFREAVQKPMRKGPLYPETIGAATVGNCRLTFQRASQEEEACLFVRTYLPSQYEDSGALYFDVQEIPEAALMVPLRKASSADRDVLSWRVLRLLIHLPPAHSIHRAFYEEGFWNHVPMPSVTPRLKSGACNSTSE